MTALPHSRRPHGCRRILGWLCALIALASIHLQAGQDLDASASPTRALIERFELDHGTLERFYNQEYSPNRRERLRKFYLDQQERLATLDFQSLDQAGRIDYLLMQHHLEHEMESLDRNAARLQEVAPLLPFRGAVETLLEARQRVEEVDLPATAQQLAELASQVEATLQSLKERSSTDGATDGKPVTEVLANRTARLVRELQGQLKDWFEFYDGYDPEFAWWLKQPYTALDKKLGSLGDYLRKDLAGYEEGKDDPLLGDPIGKEELRRALQREMIPYTPEELIEIAEKEFEWCEKERLRASRELGFGDDWRKALNFVKNQHVPPGRQPKLIKELAAEAVSFLEARDLLTIPPLAKEIWRMQMMSPERQKVSPYFTGGEVISVSFPTAEMSHEDKLMSMRGNNIHFARATVHHELIPGHHLQGFMARRYRPYRSLFRTPFLVEGWALYWEMLLWDLQFAPAPEDRMGMLFWRSHRCARIIFSLSFHLEKMSPQEAIDFLVERVGHERRNATAEVRRSIQGGYGPLYQAAYMLGGLQIRALHRELVQSGRMTNRDFHDAILRENAIPIEMIRASLTGQELTQDYQAGWRFYENP